MRLLLASIALVATATVSMGASAKTLLERGTYLMQSVVAAWNMQRIVRSKPFELNFLLQTVARHITLYFFDHVVDRLDDFGLIDVIRQGVNGVAHDQRRSSESNSCRFSIRLNSVGSTKK